MSRHGYRMVGYGGLINDIYGSSYHPAKYDHTNTPAITENVAPAQQSFSMPVLPLVKEDPVLPDTIVREYQQEMANKTAAVTSAFKAIGNIMQVITKACSAGGCDMNMQTSIVPDETISKPTVNINIELKMPIIIDD